MEPEVVWLHAKPRQGSDLTGFPGALGWLNAWNGPRARRYSPTAVFLPSSAVSQGLHCGGRSPATSASW